MKPLTRWDFYVWTTIALLLSIALLLRKLVIHFNAL